MYERKLLFFLLIAVSLCVSCLPASEAEAEPPSAGPRVDPAEAISKAEKLYQQREDPDKVREALRVLETARDMDNRNYEVEWKFARMSYYLGSRESTGEDEAEKVLERGLSAARISKRMRPNEPEGHFWYGALLGESSKRNPVTVGAASIGDIRETMNKVIEIDPGYQGASAWDALGQLEMATRNLGGGSAEKAVEYYEKALELEKKNAYVYLHLAEAYLAVDRDEDARAAIGKLLEMEPDPDYLPEHREAVAKAEKLLKEKL